jgi:hypothetical protein
MELDNKDLQVGTINFNNFKPINYLNKVLNINESASLNYMDRKVNVESTSLDNRVFKLAEKIKQDVFQLKEDYRNSQISLQELKTSIFDSHVVLDNMAEIWDINLEEYIVDLD